MIYSFCDASGVFTGQFFDGPYACLSDNTPPGCIAIVGIHDPRNSRYDFVAHEVVPWRPPAPFDDEWRTWFWSEADSYWAWRPTAAALARDVRSKRNALLSECDYVVTKSAEDGVPVPAVWRKYRKALRDISTQPGFPSAIDWPVPPDAPQVTISPAANLLR